MKKVVSLFVALALLVTLFACGAPPADALNADGGGMNYADTDYGHKSQVSSDDARAREESESLTGNDGPFTAGDGQAALRGTKMVYTARLEMETLSFDESHAGLEALVETHGGYFESKSVSTASGNYRRGEYTVRIPAGHYAAFLSEAGQVCRVTYSCEEAENIDRQYYDVQTRLTTARAKWERLQELLRQADTMADIITIESAIADTEYTIDSLTGTLARYDSLVADSTVHITVREVYQLSDAPGAPITFGQRLKSAFGDGLRATGRFFQWLVLWLAYNWSWLAPAAVLIPVIVRMAKKRHLFPRLRRKNKSESNHITNGKET